MVVKAERGRRRYVVFKVIDGPVSSDALLRHVNHAMASASLKPLKLIQFNGTMGIIRSQGQDKDKVLAALNASFPGSISIVTLRTSGTIRTLREGYF